VVVSETTTSLGAQKTIDGMRSTYLPSGHELFLSFNDTAAGSYSHFIGKGPFGMVKPVSSGIFSPFAYDYLARPDRDSYGVYAVPATGGRDQVNFNHLDAAGAIENGGYTTFGYNTRVSMLRAVENDAGDRFLVARATITSVNQPDRCEIQIAKKPAGGAFSVPEFVAGCDSINNLGVYADSAGNPVVAVMRDSGSVGLYTRKTVADPWVVTVAWTFGINLGAQMRLVQSHDGRAHVLFWNTISTGSSYNTIRVYSLTDTTMTRDVVLATSIAGQPFSSLQAAADDSLTLLRTEPMGSQPYEPYAYRISTAGVVSSRTLGFVTGGAYRYDTLAASPSGELTLVHTANARDLLMRRLTPTP
jgi:hypothetical protein